MTLTEQQINDLVNLKKIERGDVLVMYVEDDFDSESAKRTGKMLGDRFGCFTIISPKSLGRIERAPTEVLCRIALPE